ncbi:MAG: aminotransferase class V-fold PLP-dependent enzyme [Ruminococcaceae bacterium]|nr:aminotransferase class V-fold PLP-dependent enzyme [Oscillospiraceae bacterium]
MIYFDNAATTYPKPLAVVKAAETALLDYGANPGRAGHRLSAMTSLKVYETREKCADFFGADAENTIFTLNCTEAINFALKGVVEKTGFCHVITTDLEHNSVIRPLERLALQRKVVYSVADSGNSDEELIRSVSSLIRKNTKVIIMTAGCNVNGRITPVKSIASVAKRYGVCLIVDMAQAAGILPLTLQDGINIICAPGHKGLYGPMGTGILCTDGKYPLTSLIEGGTGSNSLEINQPSFLPDMLESGTINTSGVIALSKGIDFIKSKGMDNIRRHEDMLCDTFIKLASRLSDIVIYRNEKQSYLPVVAFNVKGRDSSEVARFLSDKGIYLRAGYHCNFLAHRKLGTDKSGALRFAPSAFNTKNDVIRFVKVLSEYR